jgi:hypothetical protein
MNAWETGAVTAYTAGLGLDIVATVLSTTAATAHLMPQVQAGAAGFGGSPTLTVNIGGDNVGKSSTNYAALFQGLSSILRQAGQLLESQGGFTRRDEDNKFQHASAKKEREQLERQIEAARLRQAIAERERDNHDLQVDQARGADEFLHTKYTNDQLFDWMLRQLATVYFQSYQLAYDMALKAQKCFQLEIGDPSATFVEFGYWDSLKKGLLAGDKLANDVRRMESAFLERSKREFEITKHVSLAQVAPLSLLALKESGSCHVQLPEWLFDLDYPGHYRRRIKSVSMSIPCIVGPYTSVNCTLSMTNNGIRLSEDQSGGYGDPLTADEPRFARPSVPITSIATSHGQYDGGVFELSFDDERYLPFEGAGAVSEWTIDLPRQNNQFDVSTVSDVILHVRYTAVAGAQALADAANTNLNAVLPTAGIRLFELPHEFGSEWYRFVRAAEGQEQVLSFDVGLEHLPFVVRARAAGKVVRPVQVDLVLESAYQGRFDLRLQLPGMNAPLDLPVERDPAMGGIHHVQKIVPAAPPTTMAGNWRVQIKKDIDPAFTSLLPTDIAHAFLVVAMKVE